MTSKTPDEFYAQMQYPVEFQVKKPLAQNWETIFVANNADEMQFKINSYLFKTSAEAFRFVGANGWQHQITPKGLIEYSVEEEQKQIEKLAQLESQIKDRNPDRCLEVAREMIEGALSAQHFTIPRRAKVMLNDSILQSVEFVEFDDSVVGIFSCGLPRDTEPTITVWKQKLDFGIIPQSVDKGVASFLCLLTSSIIRDFWVLERHESAYQKQTTKTRKREGKGKQRKLSIIKDYVFIPRFEYDLSKYKTTKKIATQARVTLSPHLVSGHLRRLQKGHRASEQASENASEFGLKLQSGQTFVKPHERGEIEQLRTYRSRSALQMLFQTK